MDITIVNVPPNHMRMFEEIARALGLDLKKSEPDERKAIIEAIERVELGSVENISMDIESLKKMVYAQP